MRGAKSAKWVAGAAVIALAATACGGSDSSDEGKKNTSGQPAGYVRSTSASPRSL
ncbi:peptide ABC transporter substrate-binding protein [Streptomyces badius]